MRPIRRLRQLGRLIVGYGGGVLFVIIALGLVMNGSAKRLLRQMRGSDDVQLQRDNADKNVVDMSQQGSQNGSGTFRSLVFSLLGAKVPTFAPWNENSRELSLPGAKVPGNFRSRQ